MRRRVVERRVTCPACGEPGAVLVVSYPVDYSGGAWGTEVRSSRCDCPLTRTELRQAEDAFEAQLEGVA